MKSRIGMLAFTAVMIGAASFASAQDYMSKDHPFSIRAGVFIPTDRSATNNSSWFTMGVEYRFKKEIQMDNNPLDVSVSLDYASHGDFRIVPLLVNVTKYMQDFYLTGGIGASFSKIPGEDKVRFAYQVGIGKDFNAGDFPIFVEARFMGTDTSSLNGFGIVGGIRF